MSKADHGNAFAPFFQNLKQTVAHTIKKTGAAQPVGHVTEVVGTLIKAVAPFARVGEICALQSEDKMTTTEAEVVGFFDNEILLSPYEGIANISNSTLVFPTGKKQQVGVGMGILGRVLDAMGRPMDKDTKGNLRASTFYPIHRPAPLPLDRVNIDKPLALGIRAIDGLLTCGLGQRMGIFAAAGVGKSTILGMIMRNTSADISVLALIGERGREVREFLEKDLGKEHMQRCVLVVSTSDRSSIERARAAYLATAIAEYYRDQGFNVLLMMDSVTRFARALREIGLAAGEPPTRRGFPPSVFEDLPKLMERAGKTKRGSITALYTVLVEGDDMSEPVADETRSILDGHIVLSRTLASANHYPAIDILPSVSRVMDGIVSKEHRAAASHVRALMSSYKNSELLIQIGEYKKGTDATLDTAMEKKPAIDAFLTQGTHESCSYQETEKKLLQLVSS